MKFYLVQGNCAMYLQHRVPHLQSSRNKSPNHLESDWKWVPHGVLQDDNRQASLAILAVGKEIAFSLN